MNLDHLKPTLNRLVRWLPLPARERLRAWWRARKRQAPNTTVIEDPAYAERIARENAIFADQVDVHALPEIFHYWSNRYLLPMELEFGARHPEDFLSKYLFESAQRTGAARPRFVSLGSGNCDAEVRIGQDLVARGLTDFTLECLDINEAMLERGRVLAREAGLEGRVVPLQADFNRWQPQGRFDGVMANQSLHHVLNLEGLFDAVRASLKPDAWFVVSDMIGRNGHQRWPEALAIVREFWRELPESYRYNRQLDRREPEFLDWDCAVEGFEGVRAQDIVPLLLERFGFEVFLAFGNVIDPFIDRGFGHHFDPQRDWDREFIDRVHARDEAELQAGNITPTHMLAVLTLDRNAVCRHRPGITPQRSVRRAD
ncbi:MAG: class I SAM-dependent methyltransferase [Chiayiivirga sp.]|jgi:SAM-dependent methyltransferase|uniref:class I SAM-dependent methyltransferase n=1 Tax=Chiayiivirga sp. TaxID=2041042 RepID=UPI0025B87E90|nr:class I SAM-dependent methyltransferase [Chiayiivirga sp.]MCI1729356.1 class I SAM-dependent methyltransferase [Chiayiivirga sp.]